MIRRILIVEPDPKIARELFLLFHSAYGRFEQERYEPEIAESVAEAVEQAQTVKFHCIIMDIDLPEMAGYEAIPLVKTINGTSPIIMIADKSTIELETKVREQSVYYYHLRAFGLDELKLAVGTVFEKMGKVEEIGKLNKGAAKPVLLKQMRLSRKQEKRRAY